MTRLKKHELTRYDKEEDRIRHIDARPIPVRCFCSIRILEDPGSVHIHLFALADSMRLFGEYRSAGGNLHQIFPRG